MAVLPPSPADQVWPGSAWLFLLAGSSCTALVWMLVHQIRARQLSRRLAALAGWLEETAAGSSRRRPERLQGPGFGRMARAVDELAASYRLQVEKVVTDRNQLQAVLSGLTEGVIAIDAAERVVHLNGVAAGLLGSSPADCVGRRIWEITRILEVSETLAAALQGEAPERRELRLLGGQGDRILEIQASVLRDGQGRVQGAVLVLHDLTRIRDLEQVRRDLVANLSHELKTPVTAIQAMAETLQDDRDMERQQQVRFLGKIRDQCGRLSDLLGTLLQLSRLESAPQSLRRDPVDLREAARQALQALQPVGEGKGLGFEVIMDEQPVAVRGDGEALQQVAGNLIRNAVEWTPRGGQVRVVVHCEDQGAVLEVEDTGRGMESHHRARIFERFYRVDSARSRQQGGTGLGLAIVKHIVLAHGGRVDVDSHLGRGSCFRVVLPPAAAGD